MTPLSANAARLIETLNQRHQRLAATLANGSPDAPGIDRLIADIVAAGTSVPAGPERERLRNLLYFWVSDQVGREQRPRDAPLPVLMEYVESVDGPEVDAAESRDAEPAAKASESAASSANAEARALVSIAALAQQWERAADRDNRGYLLWGKALAQAELFVDRDPDIRAFVAASTAAENAFEAKKRWRRYWLRGFQFLALFAVVAFAGSAARLAALNADEAARAKSENRELWVQQAALLAKSQKLDTLRGLTQDAIDGLNSDQLGPLEQLMKVSGDADPRTLESTLKRLQFGSATPSLREEVASAPQQAAVGTKQRAATLAERKVAAPAPQPPTLAAVPFVQYLMPTAESTKTRAAPPGKQHAASPALPSSIRTAASDSQAPALTATCSGYLWFGSKNNSKLKGGRDPNTLQRGDIVTINDQSNIRLRTPWPSDTYVITPQIGLVPSGSEVKVTGEPKTGRGSRGEQVFAQVSVPKTFCTTVYVQYTGTEEKLATVMGTLRKLGVQTPAPEKTAKAKGLSQVRYFWPEDKEIAEQISTSLAGATGGNNPRVVDLASAGTKPAKGTIEVWLDLT